MSGGKPGHPTPRPNPQDFDLKRFLRLISEGSRLKQARIAVGIEPLELIYLLVDYPLFKDEYEQARAAGYDEIAENTLEIAELEPDTRRADVRIKATQWYLSKRRAAIYGDRLDITVTKTVDIGAALGEAMQRALPQRSEIIDVLPKIEAGCKPESEIKTIDDLLD